MKLKSMAIAVVMVVGFTNAAFAGQSDGNRGSGSKGGGSHEGSSSSNRGGSARPAPSAPARTQNNTEFRFNPQPRPVQQSRQTYTPAPRPIQTHVEPTGPTQGRLPSHTEPTFSPNPVQVRQPDTGQSKMSFDHDRQGQEIKVRNPVKYQDPKWGGGWRRDYHGRPGVTINFSFDSYVDSPTDVDCYVSPWYYCPSLPPYVSADSVTVEQNPEFAWDLGVICTPRNGYGDVPLAYAVNELNGAFQNQDQNAVAELIPSDDKIGIFTDGTYDYSLDGGQFQSMMLDNVHNARTVSFEVTQVRRGHYEAVVEATQVVTDPNGGADTIYQSYHFIQVNGRYQISDFMSSHSPF